MSSQAAKPTSSPYPAGFPTTPTPIYVRSDALPVPVPDDDRDVLYAPKNWPAAPADADVDDDNDNDGNDDTDASDPAPVDLITNPPAQSFVLVFPPGGGPLNIGPQQPSVQATLHGANATVIKNVVFQSAFPCGFGRCKFVADALLETATVYGYIGRVECLKSDPPLLRAMSGVVPYGPQNAPTRRSVPWYKPYSHPCVLALLEASFFQGPKSIAAKYPDLFPSSCLDRPREHEIPPSILALVGVAIHAALAEWKSGLHRAIPFATDSFIDVYNEHMTTITGIKPKKIGAYHTMLYRLYKSASNITPITDLATVPVSTALDRVDVDGMEVD
ncbi:hypothetical protein GSI_04095 [Ganoderma sinense ZZ0214-1]|uniref:DUF6532 domain-containing protein n=1 Tax=Ganoderma sinense ZZ0214-1 TaxID=1077348 RepID=A0A2G8SI88_9APHY|nr:hypothetical protein GSI_04095 [Ganoderma sinense ZZ0214-1]